MVAEQPNAIDLANDIKINLEHAEIAAYLNCRYISAPEAIWRLSDTLAAYLPEQYRVLTTRSCSS